MRNFHLKHCWCCGCKLTWLLMKRFFVCLIDSALWLRWARPKKRPWTGAKAIVPIVLWDWWKALLRTSCYHCFVLHHSFHRFNLGGLASRWMRLLGGTTAQSKGFDISQPTKTMVYSSQNRTWPGCRLLALVQAPWHRGITNPTIYWSIRTATPASVKPTTTWTQLRQFQPLQPPLKPRHCSGGPSLHNTGPLRCSIFYN